MAAGLRNLPNKLLPQTCAKSAALLIVHFFQLIRAEILW
jgi:hypothetical protein